MAHVAVDIDGTAAAYPSQIQEICSAMMCAGHVVSILTGTSSMPVTQKDYDNKANYLNELGMGQSYNDMTVISNQVKGGLADAKAQWLVMNGVDIFIDNSQANCEAAVAAGVDIALCPWATRV